MHFTEEQIRLANRVPIASILSHEGEECVKHGKNYYWKIHDSLHFQGASWFRFSTGEGGYSIDFCKNFLNMNFQEATMYLLENFTGENVLKFRLINNGVGDY